MSNLPLVYPPDSEDLPAAIGLSSLALGMHECPWPAGSPEAHKWQDAREYMAGTWGVRWPPFGYFAAIYEEYLH